MQQLCQLKNLTELTLEVNFPYIERITEELTDTKETKKLLRKIEEDKSTKTHYGIYSYWKLLISKTADLLTPRTVQVGVDGKLGLLVDSRTPRYQIVYENASESLYVFGEESRLLRWLGEEQKLDLSNPIEKITLTDRKEVNKLLRKSKRLSKIHFDEWLLLDISIDKEPTSYRKQIGMDGKLGLLIDNRTPRFQIAYREELKASYILGRFRR